MTGHATFYRLQRTAGRVLEATALSLPQKLRDLVEGVPVTFEITVSEDLVADSIEPDTLGLFIGGAFAETDEVPMPPQIILFLGNIYEYVERNELAFRREVRTTYLHEVGHYFGWDEDDLSERGLD